MKLFVLDVVTKTQTPLTPEWGYYLSPAWSPDGKHVAFSSFSRFDEQGNPTRLSVHVVGADGGNPVDLTASLPEDVFSVFHRWSNDGGSVIFSASNQAQDSMQVHEASLDGSLTELTRPIRASILDWWNGTALTVDLQETAFIWHRLAGINPYFDTLPVRERSIQVFIRAFKGGGLIPGSAMFPRGVASVPGKRRRQDGSGIARPASVCRRRLHG